MIILEHENESLKNKITTLEEDLRKANSKVIKVNCNKKRKFSYNFFNSSHNITCYYCSTKEHVWAHCPLRKNNKQGPKIIWVPKTKNCFAGAVSAKIRNFHSHGECSRSITGKMQKVEDYISQGEQIGNLQPLLSV